MSQPYQLFYRCLSIR